jgi:hypothetical protein
MVDVDARVHDIDIHSFASLRVERVGKVEWADVLILQLIRAGQARDTPCSVSPTQMLVSMDTRAGQCEDILLSFHWSSHDSLLLDVLNTFHSANLLQYHRSELARKGVHSAAVPFTVDQLRIIFRILSENTWAKVLDECRLVNWLSELLWKIMSIGLMRHEIGVLTVTMYWSGTASPSKVDTEARTIGWRDDLSFRGDSPAAVLKGTGAPSTPDKWEESVKVKAKTERVERRMIVVS